MFASAPLLEIEVIQKRLTFIFSEGLSDRQYVIREMAARTIFSLLYIDAVEGRNTYLAPIHVYRMSTDQAILQNEISRDQYRHDCMRRNYQPPGDRWYADNTREPIRDEGLRDGLVAKGAVSINPHIPTTSSKGCYAMREHFAQLFIIPDKDFEAAALKWQSHYLSPAELARVRIMQERHAGDGKVNVMLPNGEGRNMEAGPSSILTKAVIEEFAPRFLKQPAVLWISESGKKVILQDDQLMKDIGLSINQKTLLPDLVLADIGLGNL